MFVYAVTSGPLDVGHRIVFTSSDNGTPYTPRPHDMLTFSRGRMTFTVNAISDRPGEGAFHAEKATRKDAVETAVGLLGQGLQRVTITDEAKRVYQSSEFVAFLQEGD